MINFVFDNLRSTHYETELLEVLNWDDEECEKVLKELSLYFEHFSETKPPDQVKADLEKIFPKQVRDVIFKYISYIVKRNVATKGRTEYEA